MGSVARNKARTHIIDGNCSGVVIRGYDPSLVGLLSISYGAIDHPILTIGET